MNKEMIISSTSHETRVAILEDDQVVEVFIEREQSRGVVGNIYKGRVSKVLPGMQSAFVDLGLERDAFLYVTDVISPTEEALEDERTSRPRPAPEPGAPTPRRRRRADDAGRPHGAPTAPTRRAADAAERDVAGGRGRPPRRPPTASRPARRRPKIEDLLKEGQEVVVQVVKEPLGTKGARITSHLSLPGRFLVYMPTVDHIGVSRKIESRDERRRAARHRPAVPRAVGPAGRRDHPDRRVQPLGRGHPHRPDVLPAGLDRDPAQARIRADAGRAVPRGEPGHQAAARPADRAVPGHPASTTTAEYRRVRGVRAADHAEHGRPREALREGLSDLRRVRRAERDRQGAAQQGLAEVGRLHRHQSDRGARRHRRQHRPLRRQEDRRAGSRTRSSRRTSRPRKEIVRQVRLRDLGGIIVLDFIDMEEKKNRQKVAQAVEQELRKDRAPSKAVQVSDFGLIIITRKRVKSSLERQLTEPCPYCSGTGHDQGERDDLLRHPDRGQEGQRRTRRLQPRAAREPGDRAGAQGREPRACSANSKPPSAGPSRCGPTSSCTTSSST